MVESVSQQHPVATVPLTEELFTPVAIKQTVKREVDFMCVICLESFDPRNNEQSQCQASGDADHMTSTEDNNNGRVQLIQLRPCEHLMCNDCFFLFPRKLRSVKCPACTLEITTYDVLNRKEYLVDRTEHQPTTSHSDILELFFTRAGEQSFAELMAREAEQGVLNQDELVADCLDHVYFLEELKKLLSMTREVENDLFKRRTRQRVGTENDRLWLVQIRERALDLQFACSQFEQFDPNFMLTEVHELSEMLFKVQSGKMTDEEERDAAGFFDEEDMASVPEWDTNYFEQELSSGAAQQDNQPFEQQNTNESDLGRSGVITSSGFYQNTFTITEIKQTKPFTKKNKGRRGRR